MKKLTLISGIALLAFSVKTTAQITLTESDLPTAGTTVVVDSDGITNPSPGVTNISSPQNWDFSHLLKQKSKTYGFYAPSSTKYASVFPSATLADSAFGGNGYNFFDITSSIFNAVGAEEIQSVSGTSIQIEINLNPPFTQSALPATISSNNTAGGIAKGTETTNVAIPTFFITAERFTTQITYSDTVDAYGAMKMPNGETYPVLRQKHYETDLDSVYVDIFGTWTYAERVITNKNQYDWYAKGVGYILAEEDMSHTFDTIVDVIWDTTAPAPTGISELSLKNNVNVYPNPANTEVTFNTSNSSSNADQYISIYDVTGRQVEKMVVKRGVSVLNTSAYTNGVYLYNLTDNSGNLQDRGKFVVQH